ncbi:MAG: SOS response-associated peptidase [Nannocystaceae bacterium]|nr:SOS response-associated peptidase [Nannocystaceae bacterium]
MCGRFTLTTADYVSVGTALDADFNPSLRASYQPRFNIAPSDSHWIVCLQPDAPKPELIIGTWGFPSPHGPMINARSETMHLRPTFRDAVWRQRCGVVANGFLEWSGPKGARQPYWFHRPDDAPFVFAALYRDELDPASGEVSRKFAVLTTRPNALVSPHHDRMPVILDRRGSDAWLRWSPDTRTPEAVRELRGLLVPTADEWLVSTPVSRRVSDVRNDDPECLHPVDPPTPPPEQQSLF